MLDRLILLTVCLLPLYILRFEFIIPTTLLEILIGLSVLFWVIVRLKSKPNLLDLLRSLNRPLGGFVLVFLTVSFISVWVSANWWASLGIYRAYFLEPVLLAVVIYDRFKDKPYLILSSLVVSGWLVALVALSQKLTNQAFFIEAGHEVAQGRVSAFYNSANSLALYLGPILSLIAVTWFEKIYPLNRWFLGSSFVVLGSAFVLTNSLGGYLALGVCLLMYMINWLLRNQVVISRIYYNLFQIGVVVSLIGFMVFLFNISSFTPKIGLVYPRPFEGTETVRLCLWEGTLNVLKENWLFGAGLNGFQASYQDHRTCDTELLQYPHNIFLNFWTEVGVFGLLSFLIVIFAYVRLVQHSRLAAGLKISLLSFLVYFFIHGLVDVPYFKNDLSAQFWVYLAFGLSLARSPTEK